VGESQGGISLFQALIVIGALAVLAVSSFSSGYMSASIQYEEERALRAIYRQAHTLYGPF